MLVVSEPGTATWNLTRIQAIREAGARLRTSHRFPADARYIDELRNFKTSLQRRRQTGEVEEPPFTTRLRKLSDELCSRYLTETQRRSTRLMSFGRWLT